jgi:hypothetical protein
MIQGNILHLKGKTLWASRDWRLAVGGGMREIAE